MNRGFRPETKRVDLLRALHADLEVFFHDPPVALRHVLQLLLAPVTSVACSAAHRSLPLTREFHSDRFILLHLALVDGFDELPVEFVGVLRGGNRAFPLLFREFPRFFFVRPGGESIAATPYIRCLSAADAYPSLPMLEFPRFPVRHIPSRRPNALWLASRRADCPSRSCRLRCSTPFAGRRCV